VAATVLSCVRDELRIQETYRREDEKEGYRGEDEEDRCRIRRLGETNPRRTVARQVISPFEGSRGGIRAVIVIEIVK